MKYIVTALFILISSCISLEAAQSKSINWLTNYDQAVSESKASSKPIILFFTGSDWCTWCQKLEKEVFDTQEFATSAGDKYIFVKIDTTFNTPLPKDLTDQNTKLKQKYDIRSFPTIVIIDGQEKKIGTTGYRQGGGKAYANHLEKLLKDYSNYHAKVTDLGKKKLSGPELKELYIKAKELGRLHEAVQIVNSGIETPNNHFFLVERYHFLAREGNILDSETINLRKRILEADPSNKHFSHYQVAVIDFEAACNEMEKRAISVDTAVAPLQAYIHQFGTKDPENLWRLEMIISQVYFDKGKLSESLKYAKASYESAPPSAQPDISTVISSIETQLSAQ